MQGKVLVEDAHGQAPTIPFWFGEAPVGRRSCRTRYPTSARGYTNVWSPAAPLRGSSRKDSGATRQSRRSPISRKAYAFWAPCRRRSASWPSGSSTNRGECNWSCIRPTAPASTRRGDSRCGRRYAVLSTSSFRLLPPRTASTCRSALRCRSRSRTCSSTCPLPKVEKILTQAVLQVPLFPSAGGGTPLGRWRSCAFPTARRRRRRYCECVPTTCSPRYSPSRSCARTTPCPAMSRCRITRSVFETMRDALHEAMDMNGFKRVLEDISDGPGRDTRPRYDTAIGVQSSDTQRDAVRLPRRGQRDRGSDARGPSPYGGRCRKTSAIWRRWTWRRSGTRRGDAWPLIRDADELHDALLTLGRNAA